MSKRGRRLKVREDEAPHRHHGGGPERGPETRRPFDPNYHRVSYAEDDWDGKMARTYNSETIAHYAITRRSESNGTGHLPQPVIRPEAPSLQALRALLERGERVFTPLPPLAPSPDIRPDEAPGETSNTQALPPWLLKRGTITFIE